MDLKQLLAQLQGIMDALNKLPGEEAAEATEEGKAAKRALYVAKSAEYDACMAKVEIAKAHAKRVNDVAALATLAATVVPGSIPAEAKTPESEDRELGKAFDMWLVDQNSIGGVAREALKPKSMAWKSDSGAHAGVRVPAIYAGYTPLGSKSLKKKALPMATTTATSNQLIAPMYEDNLEQYPTEDTPLFDAVRKPACMNGEWIQPTVDQEADQYAGCTVEYPAEGAAPVGGAFNFRQIDIKTYEVKTRTVVTNKFLRNNIVGVGGFITSMFGNAVRNAVEKDILNGSGVGRALGFLQNGQCQLATRQGAGLIQYKDVVKTKFKIKPQFLKRGMWFLSYDALEAITEMVDTQGRPIFCQPRNEGEPETILGRPIYWSTRQALGARGDLSYGDPSRYVMPIEQEMVIGKSEHEQFSAGNTVFLGFVAVGGKVTTANAWAALEA